MKEITSLLEFEKLKSSRLLIIDFTAAWCGPCRVISPVFDRAATDFESSEIIFAKCDVDNNADVSQACGITAMPTFKFFRKGEEVAFIQGADRNRLLDMIGKYVEEVKNEQESK